MLKNAKTSPDFTNYLTFLLASTQPPSGVVMPKDSYDIARSAAAISLKNFIKSSYKSIPTSGLAYIRSIILQGLQDPTVQIRSYAGNVITEIVRQGGLLAWPDLLSNLFNMVENKGGQLSTHTQEGAMSAIFKICEDNKSALDQEYSGQRPLAFLFPKLLEFTSSQLVKVRFMALATINVFVPDNSAVVQEHLAPLLSTLFQLAHDSSDDVRKHVCRSFLHIAEISPQSILANLEGLVNYTLLQMKSKDDPELALDAAEFWICLGENEGLVDYLLPYLPSIIPLLLESMVYSEDELLELEVDADDAEEEDRAEDIKPTFATAKAAKLTSNGNEGKGSSGQASDDKSDGEVTDDEDEDFDPEDNWTLRKCSAAALDVLAGHFHSPVFEVTLPYLKENLAHKEWPYREAAVLALGAIADGCMDAVQPHLPELTPYLLSLLQDSEPIVRQITCWTLGRYSGWAAHLDENGRRQFFEPMMEGILKCMLDGTKRVQEAAASAFANLEEKAKAQLAPYARVIIQQFVLCFEKYKDRNMFILYDCVQTLAEHIGPQLKDPELVNPLMGALTGRWMKVSDQSREMFPLLECLSYVATALDDAFTVYAEPIFKRCIGIIHQNLEDAAKAEDNAAWEQPEKDFLVTSLDLLSAIIQTIEESRSAALVNETNPSMFQLLAYCMKDSNNDVRQSAYALLGDCAIYVFPQLKPYLPALMEILIVQLDLSQVQYDGEETNFSVINNTCWSVGEIAMREKDGMQPYVDRLLTKLGTILFTPNIPDSLQENAAIGLGRLGFGCPQQLAPHLAQIAPAFLIAVNKVTWTDEKAHALVGFVQIANFNPQALETSLGAFFNEIAKAPSEFLKLGDGSRLVAFRQVRYTANPLHCI
jgi:transportin-1